MASVFSAKHYHDEDAAFAYVEAALWPNGPVCSHCGETVRVGRMGGSATRKGLHKCYKCRKQFTVRQGTLFESSHLPLHVWLQAIYLIAGSKKGISSHQLARTLGLTVKSAWFLSHRIREAMREGDLAPFGEDGGAVEVDETYIGRKAGTPLPKGGWGHKMTVLGLIDRDTGKSRFFHVDGGKEIQGIVLANLSREARLMTDEHVMYRRIGREFAEHASVMHYNKEYVRGDVTTNTIEGAFSIFKRGMRGVYQHCAEKHLHRYLAEFEFRHNNRIALGVNDGERAALLAQGIQGKRLTYRRTHAAKL